MTSLVTLITGSNRGIGRKLEQERSALQPGRVYQDGQVLPW